MDLHNISYQNSDHQPVKLFLSPLLEGTRFTCIIYVVRQVVVTSQL